MVTHDPLVAARAHTTLHLEKGVLVEGERKGVLGGRCGMKFSRFIFGNLFRKKIRLLLTIGSFAWRCFVCVPGGGEGCVRPRRGHRGRRPARHH